MSWNAESFLNRYFAFEPEEATTLGLRDYASELRDMSQAGQEARARFLRESRDEIRAFEEPLDLALKTLLRHLDFELHAHETGIQAANPQWCTYPYTTTRYLAAQEQADAARLRDESSPYFRRALGVPRFLDDHAAALLRARDDGQVAHQAFLRCLIDHELPAARDYFQDIHEPAAAAFEAHRQFLEEEILPQAPEHRILGAERYAELLAICYHIDTPLADLVERAEAALGKLQTEMTGLAAELGLGEDVRDFAVIRDYMIESQKEPLPAGTDIAAHYRGIMERAMAHLAARGEFEARSLDELRLDHYPEGMRDQGPGTNWPAPLFDKEAAGQFVIHPDQNAHSLAWSTVLAVHEGAPGHFLQSQGFRRLAADRRAAIAFLAVADDVAIPRLNFSSMLNIEGYAVYAEECLRRSGFHQGRDRLFALAAHALRAVRVIAEINLHRGVFSPEDCERFVTENAGLPSAFWELQRYQRGPLQAVAYFFGAEQFFELREAVEAARGEAFSAAAFHEEILAFGPALPAEMKDEMPGLRR